MFCQNCGIELSSNAKFCPKCGAKIEKETEKSLNKQTNNVNNTIKEIPVKRPLMKVLGSCFIPFGVALLILGCAFLFSINYDKNEIKSWSNEYYEWQLDMATKDVNGVRFGISSGPKEERKHYYAFYRQGKDNDLWYDIFEQKLVKLNDKDDYADYIFEFYMGKLYVTKIIISGSLLFVAGIIARASYKKSQKEEESK